MSNVGHYHSTSVVIYANVRKLDDAARHGTTRHGTAPAPACVPATAGSTPHSDTIPLALPPYN
ncbi:hypothetical protein RR48_08043 [Papilio machaon]|uniref:Uncharacterized protein n=1 Tax=Papilio machaon TaxID=76193 RepID=A0A194R215_PAPMA|nr:hypothetical protein RR48_08043 [Papilio machaon]